MLRAKKGRDVEVKKGANEGLTGTIVGRTVTGKAKVRLDDGATRFGNSVVKVDKKKLRKNK